MKIIVILAFRKAPPHFGNSHQARPYHMLGMFPGRHMLAPQITLHTKDHRHYIDAERIGSRIQGISLFKRDESRSSSRFTRRIILAIIKVTITIGSHHGLMSRTGGCNTALGTSPRHHRSVRSQSALQNLVPAQQTASLTVKKHLNTMHQIALQSVNIFQSFLPHPSPTARTCRPTRFVRFITSNMDIFRGKKFNDFRKHILQKFEGFFIANTQVLIDIRLAAAGKLRIGCQHLLAMPGHLNLGNHGDMQGASVFNHLADLLLHIITAFGRRIIPMTVTPVAVIPLRITGIGPPSRKIRQLGIFLDLDTPASTVGQMPMKPVELVAGQQIELPFDKLLIPEMTRYVEHEAPVSETRSVFDRNGGNTLPRMLCQLRQRLQTVKQTGCIRSRNRHAVADDIKPITLGGTFICNPQPQSRNIAFEGFDKRNGEKPACNRTLHPRCKIGFFLPLKISDISQRPRHTECPFTPIHMLRNGNDSRRKGLRRPAACPGKQHCGKKQIS